MPTKEEYWKNPQKYRAATRAYGLEHPEWKRESDKQWMRKRRAKMSTEELAAERVKWKNRDPVGHLLMIARKRASQQGIPFDLEHEDLVMPEVCPVFGVPFEWGVGVMGWRNMRAPSLDKIKPHLGYVKGNVRIISMRANHLKSNGTISEFEAVLAYMKREGCAYDWSEQPFRDLTPREQEPSAQGDLFAAP